MIISYQVIDGPTNSFGSINFVERPAPRGEWVHLHKGSSDCVMIVPGKERDDEGLG